MPLVLRTVHVDRRRVLRDARRVPRPARVVATVRRRGRRDGQDAGLLVDGQHLDAVLGAHVAAADGPRDAERTVALGDVAGELRAVAHVHLLVERERQDVREHWHRTARAARCHRQGTHSHADLAPPGAAEREGLTQPRRVDGGQRIRMDREGQGAQG